MKFYIVTVWYHPEDPDLMGPLLKRAVMRLPGRIDLPNHDDIKAHVLQQLRISYPNVYVVFGEFSEAKDQGTRL